MRVSGLISRNIESIGTLSTTGVPVNVTIANSRMLGILWHTLLLPLSGFVSGAALGYIVLQTEVATIVGAVAGLIIAVWCTRQIPLQAVTIEIASDTNHGEHE
jgi:positive regulator of sigma E activity